MEDNHQYRLACASWSMLTEAEDLAADLLLSELGPVAALKLHAAQPVTIRSVGTDIYR